MFKGINTNIPLNLQEYIQLSKANDIKCISEKLAIRYQSVSENENPFNMVSRWDYTLRTKKLNWCRVTKLLDTRQKQSLRFVANKKYLPLKTTNIASKLRKFSILSNLFIYL